MRAYNTEQELLNNVKSNYIWTTLDMTNQDPKVIRQLHDHLITLEDLSYVGKLKGEGIFYFQFQNEKVRNVFFAVLDVWFKTKNIEVCRLNS